MKYSHRPILTILNENIFIKPDMNQQYKISEMPLLKNIANMLYTTDRAYNKLNKNVGLKHKYPLRLSSYLPEVIEQSIRRMDCKTYEWQFSIHERLFDVQLLVDERKEYRHHEIDEYFKKIYMWLCIASHYASPECSNTVNIHIYLTGHKKTLPKKYETVGRENANTAFTTSCQTNTEINIFRQEEWFKTFIHETFHCMGMDFSANGSQNTNTQLYTFIPIETDVRLYETYTECWAEIIHSLFVAYAYSKTAGAINMETAFNTILNNERRFTVFQCEKVLQHYNMNMEDLYKQTQLSATRRQNYKEETPVVAYYILKTVCMYNVTDFISWSSKNNGHSINFNKKPRDSKEKSFVQFIKKRLNNPTMMNMLEKANKYLVVNKTKKNFATQTLRMTMYE
jgi:hypothetical protein